MRHGALFCLVLALVGLSITPLVAMPTAARSPEDGTPPTLSPRWTISQESSQLRLALEMANFTPDGLDEVVEVLLRKINVRNSSTFDLLWTYEADKEKVYFEPFTQPDGSDIGLVVSMNSVDAAVNREIIFEVIGGGGQVVHTRTLTDNLVGENKFGGFLKADVHPNPGVEVVLSVVENQNTGDGEFSDTVISHIYVFEAMSWSILSHDVLQNSLYLSNTGFNGTDPLQDIVMVEKVESYDLGRVVVHNGSLPAQSLWNSSWYNNTGLVVTTVNHSSSMFSDLLIWVKQQNQTRDEFFTTRWLTNPTRLVTNPSYPGFGLTTPLSLHTSVLSDLTPVYLVWGSDGMAWRDLDHSQRVFLNQSYSVRESLRFDNDSVLDLFVEESVNGSTRSLAVLRGSDLSPAAELPLNLPFNVGPLTSVGRLVASSTQDQPLFMIGQRFYQLEQDGFPTPGLVVLTTPQNGDRFLYCTAGALQLEWKTLLRISVKSTRLVLPWQTVLVGNRTSYQLPVDTNLVGVERQVRLGLVVDDGQDTYEDAVLVTFSPHSCQGDLWPTEPINLTFGGTVHSYPGLSLIVTGVLGFVGLAAVVFYVLDHRRNPPKNNKP